MSAPAALLDQVTEELYTRHTADADGIVASGHNGVLEIVIPKRPQSTPRRIQVGAAAKA